MTLKTAIKFAIALLVVAVLATGMAMIFRMRVP